MCGHAPNVMRLLPRTSNRAKLCYNYTYRWTQAITDTLNNTFNEASILVRQKGCFEIGHQENSILQWQCYMPCVAVREKWSGKVYQNQMSEKKKGSCGC